MKRERKSRMLLHKNFHLLFGASTFPQGKKSKAMQDDLLWTWYTNVS